MMTRNNKYTMTAIVAPLRAILLFSMNETYVIILAILSLVLFSNPVYVLYGEVRPVKRQSDGGVHLDAEDSAPIGGVFA